MTQTPPPSGMLRLFIAVPVPQAWLTVLGELQRQLRDGGPRLRYVRPESIHLTLRFLGDTPAGRLVDVAGALDAATTGTSSFTLRLGRPGHFGSASRPRVIWMGIEGDTGTLAALQRAVELAVRTFGATPEEQRFRAHLTLARIPDGLERADLARIVPVLDSLQIPAAPDYRPSEVQLIRSELSRAGPTYTVLHRARIGGTDRST